MGCFKKYGGIVFNTTGVDAATTTKPTNFDDVVIENCTVMNNSFAGITFKQWDGGTGWGLRNTITNTAWNPHTNITIRNNYINQADNVNACNGIYLTDTKGAVVENNVIEKAGTSGIELYYTDNVVVQKNEVFETTRKAGGADYNGIDPDKGTTNTIVQYNYVHDNGDGILLCQFLFGTSVVRYNVLVNNSRDYINLHANKGPHYIYNNTFYNDNTKSTFNFIDSSGGASTVTYPVYIANNIFYSTGSSSTPKILKVDSVTYDNNLYYGPNVSQDSSDVNAIINTPKFKDPGKARTSGETTTGHLVNDISGYELQSGSPAIEAGYDTATKYDYTTVAARPTLDIADKLLYNGSTDLGALEYYGDTASSAESIIGYVKDTYGNNIAGANVSVTGNGITYSGISDISGFYSIQSIPFGSSYTVTATKTGYDNASSLNVKVAVGNVTRKDLVITSQSNTGAISGTVADCSGNVLSGAIVTTMVNSQSYSTQTDVNGVYTLNDVPAGATVTLIASKSGYVDGQSTSTTVIPGSTVSGVQIKLTKLDSPVYYINDSFDGLTAGTDFTGGSSTLTGWTTSVGNSVASIKVDNTVTGSTGNVIHINRPTKLSDGTMTTMYKSGLNLTGIVTFETRIAESGGSTSYWLTPYITDSSGKNIVSIYSTNGKLYSYVGTSKIDAGITMSTSTWHTMKLVMNTNTKTYTMYIDDMNTPITGFNNVSFRDTTATNIDKVEFRIEKTYGGHAYIDYVRLNSGYSNDSDDADLSNITVSSGALTKKDALTYEANAVPNYIDKVTVTPTTDSLFATVTVNGVGVQSGQQSQEISLSEGDNTINIEVTAEDGTTKQNYSIKIYRTTSDAEATLKDLIISQGTLTPSFANDVYDYSVSVPYSVSSITLQPTASVATESIKVNNTAVESGQTSQNISLIEGDNPIQVVVGSTNGAEWRYYNITVNRAVNPNTDTEAPVITLVGESTVNLVNGSSYIDEGVTITDNVDNGLTPVITYTKNDSIVSSIDISSAGTYVVHYNVSDATGNPAIEVIRIVIVADAITQPPTGDTQAPAEVTGANV